MSLGDYLFMPTNATKESIKHECGHCRQSDILGPLYLIVIGVPSVIHNIVHAVCSKLVSIGLLQILYWALVNGW